MKSRKKNNKIEYIVICIIYLIIALFVVFAKRPEISELENRKLEEFPKKIDKEELLSGEYFNKIDLWFSDTVPKRDFLLELSYRLKELNGFATKIDMRNYVPVIYENEEVIATKSIASASIVLEQLLDINKEPEDVAIATKSEQSKINDYYKENGLLVFEDGGALRAVEEFSGFRNGDETYAYTLNLYKELMPQVNIYSMIIPTAIAYYAPNELKDNIPSIEKFINIINSFIRDDIVKVDVYNKLLKHKDEDIYLRTDHHWSPLGAYYATEEFAKVAKVAYNSLDSYEKKSLKRYQGSLYKLSGNERLKDSREPFYLPKDINYKVTKYSYQLDAAGKPIAKTSYTEDGKYFYLQDDGFGTGYSLYMGSDNNTTVINIMGNTTGRNLLLLKDSFGNPIPSFLLYSFDNIHIVDYRYFIDNIVAYVGENKITDILFANNDINVIRDRAASKYRELLMQGLE